MKLDFAIKVSIDLNDEEIEFIKTLDKKTIDNKCKPFFSKEIETALRKVFIGHENIKINVNSRIVKEK